jgi:hypothetical protein
MPLIDLSAEERAVVGQCLTALATGAFIPFWEMHAITGLTPAEAASVAWRWPEVDERNWLDERAIYSALTWAHWKALDRELWPRYVAVSPTEVERVRRKWLRESTPTYLDRLRNLVEPPGRSCSTNL